MREVTKTPEQPKIIGYKFKEGFKKYRSSAEMIVGAPFDGVFLKDTLAYKDMVAAGVLDLWFEPVYEEIDKVETITLRCEGGTFEIQVSKKGIYYAPDNVYLSADGLRIFLDEYAHCNINYSNKNKAQSGFYKFSGTHIDSGCKKGVPIGDWYNVIDAYNKIKNS